MRKVVFLLITLTSFLSKAQLPYLNASTGNIDEFPIDLDSNMYGFYNNTLFKIDKNQSVIWAKNYSTINFSGLLLSKTGSLFFFGNNSLGKLDMNGNLIWAKSIDGINAITTGTNASIHSVICNRTLLDRDDNLVTSGESNTGNGFILKTDTNGNFIKLRMISIGNTICPSQSYGFQVINDSAGLYKLIRFGERASMCAQPQSILSFNYNDYTEILSNNLPIAINSADGYIMQWNIKKSKRNTDFYLHIGYRPGGSGQPLDITVSKFNSSGKNLWTTRLTNLDGPTVTLGLNATENYKGQILCELANPNTTPQKIAVNLIDTNGVTNGNCLVTYTCSGFSAGCWGATRLQSRTNNSFLFEKIINNPSYNSLNVLQINSTSTPSCVQTKTCSYSTFTSTSNVFTTNIFTINPVISYTINSISPTFTNALFNINTTNCPLTNIGFTDLIIYDKLINLHPNPTSNILKFDLTNSAEIEEVLVLDVNGKVLKTHLNCKEISVNELTPGIYFLQLKSDGQIYYSKFIKE